MALFTSARSLDEYAAMFDLNLSLPLRFLDCAGGAASFTAEVRRLGMTSVALDPIYALPSNELASLVLDGVATASANLKAEPDRYRWDNFFTTPEDHRLTRATAAAAFLEDRLNRQGGYVAGSLHKLPFGDQVFDSVLCSHLLFTHAGQFDEAFLLKCLTEMMRVSSRDVRIYPVLGFDSDASPLLDAALLLSEEHAYSANLVSVPYEFLDGADQMLLLVRE